MNKNPNIEYIADFISKHEAEILYNKILYEIDLKNEYIKIYGKSIKCPRKVAFFGNKGVNYKYSGLDHKVEYWPKYLLDLKNIIEKFTNYEFNFVLINYYKDGNDYMGYHSDNEKSLGEHPVIASLSLGADRKFIFKNNISKELHNIILENASLLVMKEGCQEEWKHSIPKMKNIHKGRINLTFRKII